MAPAVGAAGCSSYACVAQGWAALVVQGHGVQEGVDAQTPVCGAHGVAACTSVSPNPLLHSKVEEEAKGLPKVMDEEENQDKLTPTDQEVLRGRLLRLAYRD